MRLTWVSVITSIVSIYWTLSARCFQCIISFNSLNKLVWWLRLSISDRVNRYRCQIPCIRSDAYDAWIQIHYSISISSVAQLCLTLCDHMDCSMPGFPVHHQLPELTQTHVHRVSDAIQSSHPLLSPSPPVFNLSQHEGFFQ